MSELTEIVLTIRNECPGFYHPNIYILEDKSIDIYYKEADFVLLINLDEDGTWGCYGMNEIDTLEVECENDMGQIIKFLKEIR